MDCTVAFAAGVGVGLVVALVVAGWVWIDLTHGDDHPLSGDEIRERVGEVYR
jgi:hypothetical protein